MKITRYYHKNSDKLAFRRIEYSKNEWYEKTYDEKGNVSTYKNSNGIFYETTYDENNNELTFKSSDGLFLIKGKEVSEDEYNNFINKPCAGKKVVIDGVEYELK